MFIQRDIHETYIRRERLNRLQSWYTTFTRTTELVYYVHQNIHTSRQTDRQRDLIDYRAGILRSPEFISRFLCGPIGVVVTNPVEIPEKKLLHDGLRRPPARPARLSARRARRAGCVAR